MSRAGPGRRAVLALAMGALVVFVAGAGAVWWPGGEPGADPPYDTSVAAPALLARRPRVLFDEGHRNIHSARGRFAPFANLLRADGCTVRRSSGPSDKPALASADILVIVNAAGPKGRRADAAFSQAEIASIRSWVETGGALLLVADHHPFGPAAAALGAAFGVTMSGGWCEDETNGFAGTADTGAIAFRRERAMLGDHPILAGRSASERVDTVVTFTGQSLDFGGARGAVALLRCADTAVDRVPTGSKSQAAGGRVTTTFDTETRPAGGNAQALAMEVGKGRVVVCAEAAMLSAQVDAKSGLKFGMNIDGISNRQFVLNTLRWLARELP